VLCQPCTILNGGGGSTGTAKIRKLPRCAVVEGANPETRRGSSGRLEDETASVRCQRGVGRRLEDPKGESRLCSQFEGRHWSRRLRRAPPRHTSGGACEDGEEPRGGLAPARSGRGASRVGKRTLSRREIEIECDITDVMPEFRGILLQAPLEQPAQGRRSRAGQQLRVGRAFDHAGQHIAPGLA